MDQKNYQKPFQKSYHNLRYFFLNSLVFIIFKLNDWLICELDA